MKGLNNNKNTPIVKEIRYFYKSFNTYVLLKVIETLRLYLRKQNITNLNFTEIFFLPKQISA